MVLHPSLSHCGSNPKRRLRPSLIRIRVTCARFSRCRAKTPHVYCVDSLRVQPRRGLDERPPRCGASLALEYAMTLIPLSGSLFLNVLTIYFFNKPPCPLAAQRGAYTTDLPRLDVSPKRCRRSSTKMASRSSSHVTRSRTRWTVLRCCVSASYSVCHAGLEQWIMECCPPMGYTGFQPLQKR